MKFTPPIFQRRPAASIINQATQAALEASEQENRYLKRQLALYKALLAAKAETIRLLRNQQPQP